MFAFLDKHENVINTSIFGPHVQETICFITKSLFLVVGQWDDKQPRIMGLGYQEKHLASMLPGTVQRVLRR